MRVKFMISLSKEVTPELLAETEALGAIYSGPEGRKIVQKMGARGWLCPTWAKEYGGLGTSEMIRFRHLNKVVTERELPENVIHWF